MNIKAVAKRENSIDCCVSNIKENVQIKFTTKLIDMAFFEEKKPNQPPHFNEVCACALQQKQVERHFCDI